MNAEIGRDEERGGNVFHAATEVVAELRSGECGVRSPRVTAKGAKNAKGNLTGGRPRERSFTTTEYAEYTEEKLKAGRFTANYAKNANTKTNCRPPAVRTKGPEVLEGTCLRRRSWTDDRVMPEPFIEEGFAFAPVRSVYEGRLGRSRDRSLRPLGTI
jgi:hypothetical protein